jgi:hypothetical protein
VRLLGTWRLVRVPGAWGWVQLRGTWSKDRSSHTPRGSGCSMSQSRRFRPRLTLPESNNLMLPLRWALDDPATLGLAHESAHPAAQPCLAISGAKAGRTPSVHRTQACHCGRNAV